MAIIFTQKCSSDACYDLNLQILRLIVQISFKQILSQNLILVSGQKGLQEANSLLKAGQAVSKILYSLRLQISKDGIYITYLVNLFQCLTGLEIEISQHPVTTFPASIYVFFVCHKVCVTRYVSLIILVALHSIFQFINCLLLEEEAAGQDVLFWMPASKCWDKVLKGYNHFSGLLAPHNLGWCRLPLVPGYIHYSLISAHCLLRQVFSVRAAPQALNPQLGMVEGVLSQLQDLAFAPTVCV